MIESDRRGAIAGVLASAVAPRAALFGERTVSVADFADSATGNDEDAFRAALAAAATVVVPPGIYNFSSGKSVEIPSRRTLIASGPASIRKQGAHLQPLFRAANAHDVVMQGLELRGASRLEQQIVLRPGQRELPLPWGLGTPPTIAIALIAAGRRLPLQPGTDFAVRGNSIVILPKVEMPGVTIALVWREQALCPLVELSETTDSSLLDLACFDGALWIRGTENRPLRTMVRGCNLSNGQIRVWGQDNEVTPIQIDMHRSETPNGPRSIRIERNRFTGRIASNAAKHYLRFGERAAGIEIQSYATDITIVDNDIRRQAGDGIWLASCADTLVADNHVEGNGLSGIGLETRTIRESQRCIISDNTVLNNWFDGCDMNFGSGSSNSEIALARNIFSGNGFDMSPVSGGCGIFVNGAHNAEIVSNVCEDNNLGGIVCVKSDSIRLERNRCLNNGRSHRTSFGAGVGIGVNNSTNMDVVANVCGRGDTSRQRMGIAFASEADLRRARVARNEARDGTPAKIGVWDGRHYRGSGGGA